MSAPAVSIDCGEGDFYRDNILVVPLSPECSGSEPKFEVASLPFDRVDFSRQELQLFLFVYGNGDFSLAMEVKMIPVSFPPEILFVRICCKRHFQNRELTIRDRRANEIIKLRFDDDLQ